VPFGQVAFSAFLEPGFGGTTADNNVGVWSEGSGTLSLTALEGQQAPTLAAGVLFDGMSRPSLSNTGATAFYGRLKVGSGNVTSDNDTALWSEYGGFLQAVAREGDSAPNIPVGSRFSDLGVNNSIRVQNNVGQSAFREELTPGFGGADINNNQGIWSEGGGSLQLVAREGFQAPDTALGSNFGMLPPPSLNVLGQIAFPAELQQFTGDVVPANNYGIWSDRTGSLRLVVRKGSQAAGAPIGANYMGFANISLNDSGQIAFTSALVVGVAGVTNNNSDGIWAERGGSLQLVAREGNQSPDTPVGANFSFDSFAGTPVFNDLGQLAFRAELQLTGGGVNATNNEGIWSEGAGALAMIARKGAHAAGTPNDVKFDTFSNFIGLNDRGQVVFEASLLYGLGGVDSSNDNGIWAQDRNGELRLVAREGALVDVDDGIGVDMRTISELLFVADEGFNFLGQTAFAAKFTDGTRGVFVSDVASVPEASTVLLLTAGLITFAVINPKWS
jgi:hypothetical protein